MIELLSPVCVADIADVDNEISEHNSTGLCDPYNPKRIDEVVVVSYGGGPYAMTDYIGIMAVVLQHPDDDSASNTILLMNTGGNFVVDPFILLPYVGKLGFTPYGKKLVATIVGGRTTSDPDCASDGCVHILSIDSCFAHIFTTVR